MRIRKNAKLSPLLFSSSSSSSQGGSVQTHVCQLNQSPWDVIPFDSDSIQFEGEDDSFVTAGNGGVGGGGGGSAGDSIGAVESVASMMVDDNHKGEDVAMDDNGDKGVAKNSCCQGFDGKGWPCKNQPKQGQSFCNHHFSQLRSNNNNTPSSKKAAAVAAAAAGARRARARSSKKTAQSSNPYEFYYYSGFGPLWGKRRGDRNGEGSKNGAPRGGEENSAMEESDDVMAAPTPTSDVVGSNNNNNNTHPSVEMDNNEEFDYVDNDEEEDANDGSGKKRMRKPVKARSLKSLM